MPDKPYTISCRVNDEDFDRMKRNADALDLTQSDYIRYLIRMPIAPAGVDALGDVVVLDTDSIALMQRELTKWEHHYNQGIHALNAINYYLRRGKQDDEYFLAQIERAHEKLEQTEAGRHQLMDEIERLERMTVIGG